MRNVLPTALEELERACSLEREEVNKLYQFYDEFERLREEDVNTQGYSYLWTNQGAELLSQRLGTARLKATYIPRNTQEFLALPSQLGVSLFPRGSYDSVLQICCSIRSERESYFPQGYCGSVQPRHLCLTLSEMAELLYRQGCSCLSIDEMKESYQPNLVMRSKKMLATHVALLLELGLIQGSVPGKSFALKIDYEFAPLFALLRTLKNRARCKC